MQMGGLFRFFTSAGPCDISVKMSNHIIIREIHIIQILDEEKHEVFVDGAPFIASPPQEYLTDEDSGEENGGDLIDDLNYNQLLSKAEVVMSNNSRIGSDVNHFSGFSIELVHTESSTKL